MFFFNKILQRKKRVEAITIFQIYNLARRPRDKLNLHDTGPILDEIFIKIKNIILILL